MFARPFRIALSHAVVALALLFFVTPPASAHTELISTDPKSGATLSSPPAEVTLTFTDQMSGEFNTLSLFIADLEPITLEARTDGNHVRARVPTDVLSEVGTQGVLQWKLVYRVVSADGHPVAGEVAFTSPLPAEPELGESPAGESGTAPDSETAPGVSDEAGSTDQPADSGQNDQTDGSSPTTPFLVITAIVVAASVAFAVFAVRRRARDRASADV